MNAVLSQYLDKHHACQEGRQYVKEMATKGVDTPDKLWACESLPHPYRIWMLSKAVPLKTLVEFVIWTTTGIDLSESPRAAKAVQALTDFYYDQPGKPSTSQAMVECLWLPNEMLRLAWRKAYKKVVESKQCNHLKDEEKKLCIYSTCCKAMHEEQTKHHKMMFAMVPEIK